MPRQQNVTVYNNFRNGLITEATALNFPENAVTETYNCEFDLDGSVYRRLGFDFESDYTEQEFNRDGKAVSSYLWKNVGGGGDVSVAVVQIGMDLHFYEITEDNSFSQGFSDTLTLTPVTGAISPETIEVQYADGNGVLIVTHPFIEPTKITYDLATHTAADEDIIIKIRDFEGSAADTLAVDERPTSNFAGLTPDHLYNLYNQGWNTAPLNQWDTDQTTMPSNADVMWLFRDASNDFDSTTASIDRVVSGNTPAPRGHFILELANQDRDTAAGTTGVAATTTNGYRPATSAFFAGRIFYSSINTPGFNSNIYFSQILERADQYGKAYQVNDPTSENLFDLLPSDGGVISIPEAGSIHKLFPVPGGLSVHAENGVWFITGSTGLGFTANDYTVQKIAEIPSLTPYSFVKVNGFPCWWNAEGIYLMTAQSTGDGAGRTASTFPAIQTLTDGKIETFFNNIPLNSKRYARGIYHYTDGHVRWLYRSTATSDVTEIYEFDRVLNLNVKTGAFYPWTITESDVKVNSIIVSDLMSGNVSALNVIDGSGNNVQDGAGNDVIAFSTTGAENVPFDKYLVSYRSGTTYKVTFASKINANYVDWFLYDFVNHPYESYFITGFKLIGQGSRKFQDNLIRVYSRLETPVKYYFQGIWDFALTGSGTGKWSSKQYVEHTNTSFGTASRRLKIRGHGFALQYKVTSVDLEPFDIVGWSSFESINQLP